MLILEVWGDSKQLLQKYVHVQWENLIELN